MEVVEQLVQAVMDGESPKKFFRHMQRKKKKASEPPRYVPPPRPRTMDCHDWDEWEDMEDWQRIAAEELQAELGEMALTDVGTRHFDVDDGHAEYRVYENDDVAEATAVSQVEEQLDDEPENFNQDWLEGYIDTDRLRDQLSGDEENSVRDQYDNEWSDYETKRQELIGIGYLDEDDFYEDGVELEIEGELESKIDDAYESFITATVEERLRDPMAFLRDIYGDEAAKRAMEIAGIDTARAAQDAVSTDGWQHFLSPYDGGSSDLPSGAVYVRTN